MFSEGDRLKVADDIPVALVFKNHDIEKSITRTRPFKKRERTAVKSAISNQSKASLARWPTFRFKRELRWARRGNLDQRQNVAQRSEGFFQIRGGATNDFRVQAHASELDEILAIGHREIEGDGFTLFDDPPSFSQVSLRQADFLSQNIHGAHGQDA